MEFNDSSFCLTQSVDGMDSYGSSLTLARQTCASESPTMPCHFEFQEVLGKSAQAWAVIVLSIDARII